MCRVKFELPAVRFKSQLKRAPVRKKRHFNTTRESFSGKTIKKALSEYFTSLFLVKEINLLLFTPLNTYYSIRRPE